MNDFRKPAGTSWPERSVARSIPGRFEEQVSAHGDRIAVCAGSERLTYAQLNEAANRVARTVLSAAPQTNAVAVLLPHCASMMVALLGVLKAGKIFVPLDPRQPIARLHQILEDSEAQVVIANEQSLPDARQLVQPGIAPVDIDSLDPSVSGTDLALSIAGNAAACLMYTSGSTGVPKGVLQTHANMLHRVGVYSDLIRLTCEDRQSLMAPCSVAQGLSSTLQVLLNGASLHLFDLPEVGVGALAPWLIEHSITVMVSTVSTFRHFSKTLAVDDRLHTLRAIRLGSEPILPEDLALYRQHFTRDCMLVGTLGSTEAGPIAYYVMDHDTTIDGVAPAGHPSDGATVSILDDEGGACGPGELGEIAVQGPCVFSGYWKGRTRTASLSVDGSVGDGERLYRTGDLGVFRSDGLLEVRGRKDFRVKIRGFRVELEEIERTLSASPLVAESAVVARSDTAGDSRLVAYVVPAQGQTPVVDGLRAHLRSTLPEYMVPPSFEFLPALPLTATGKVDRTALTAALRTMTTPCRVEQPPTDLMELCLVNLWERLLQHRPVDVTSNFFDLGGDSLLAARLSASIEHSFGTKLPLAAFFRAATIKQQAALLRDARPQRPWPSLVPIRADGSKPPLFCVHLSDGNLLSYRGLMRHLPPDQPVYGLQSRGLDGVSAINTRIEDMARDYVAEIRRFCPDGPYALCGWSYGGIVAFEMARQMEQQGVHVPLLALFDSHVTPPTTSIRTLVRRVPIHVATFVDGGNPLAYLGRRIRSVRRHVADAIWRKLMLWHRRGGWLPRALQNITQANRMARRDYLPGSYGGDLVFFRVSHRSEPSASNALGWESFVTGRLVEHEVPGNHISMMFDPHVATLSAKLVEHLEDAWAATKANDGHRAA